MKHKPIRYKLVLDYMQVDLRKVIALHTSILAIVHETNEHLKTMDGVLSKNASLTDNNITITCPCNTPLNPTFM